jgi:hypothetical protein
MNKELHNVVSVVFVTLSISLTTSRQLAHHLLSPFERLQLHFQEVYMFFVLSMDAHAQQAPHTYWVTRQMTTG